jgi:hypothetical protein
MLPFILKILVVKPFDTLNNACGILQGAGFKSQWTACALVSYVHFCTPVSEAFCYAVLLCFWVGDKSLHEKIKSCYLRGGVVLQIAMGI